MPIINTPVQPYKNPPYRGKIVEAGGSRMPDDWRHVYLHFRTNGAHLVVHDSNLYDEVTLEIHEEWSKDGTHEVENCPMLSFNLTASQRMELAVYLLSTIQVMRSNGDK